MKIESRWAKVTLGGAVIGFLLLPVGALGSRFGVWPFTLGFLFLAAGVLLAIVALTTGLIALATAARRARAGRSPEYPPLALGVVLSALVLGGIGLQIGSGLAAPPIHNISTDLDDPPVFQVIVGQRQGANPHRFDARQQVGTRTLGEVQRTAYPEVTTLRSSVDVAPGVERAVSVLESMGLDVVNVDPAAGIVEATATTFWFGFKDDVVVRLRRTGDGTLVDLHSVSRVGQGDLGLNANRILTFLERFGAE